MRDQRRSVGTHTYVGISSLYKLPGDYSQFAIVSRWGRSKLKRGDARDISKGTDKQMRVEARWRYLCQMVSIYRRFASFIRIGSTKHRVLEYQMGTTKPARNAIAIGNRVG